jgi:hypothetical protein
MDEFSPGEISNFPLDFLPEALNSFLSRFASFIIPVKKKGSTNFFLGFLDSSGRNIKMF